MIPERKVTEQYKEMEFKIMLQYITWRNLVKNADFLP